MTANLSLSDDKNIFLTVSESALRKQILMLALKDWGAKISVQDLETTFIISTQGMSDFQFEDTIRDIQGVFDEIGIKIQVDKNAFNELKKIQEEDEIFLRECKAARDVWDGNLDIPEFKKFSKSVQENISAKEFPDGLYTKQLLASYHLAASGSACNFSVPGAGKTVNVWAAYSYLNSLPKNNPRHVNAIFVIGPNPCFEPWEAEFKKCFGRKSKSVRFSPSLSHTQKINILKGITQADNELYLCHFQTFSLYINDFLELFQRPEKKVMLVVDEAHNIKRHDGKWANAVLNAAPHAHSRVILTGTPAPKGYEDLKNLFDFIHPNRNIIKYDVSQLRLMSENKIPPNEMIESVRPFYIRIKKSDLNIPPPTTQIIQIEMSTLQERIYKEIESKFIKGQATKIFQNANLVRLRQAATNPMLLLKPIEKEHLEGDVRNQSRIIEVENYLKEFSSEADLPRLNYLLNISIAAKEKGEKLIIWSYFIGTIELITNYLKNLIDCPVNKITGAVPMGENEDESSYQEEASNELTRGKILKEFREAKGASILVATPQCIGESISLHMECHKAIYYDRDFNCGLFIQSKDRIHRKGLLPGTITEYIYLNSKYTVDDQIHDSLEIKESRMLKLLESDEIPLLTDSFLETKADDIKRILNAYHDKQL